jgi:hypothetical protein
VDHFVLAAEARKTGELFFHKPSPVGGSYLHESLFILNFLQEVKFKRAKCSEKLDLF